MVRRVNRVKWRKTFTLHPFPFPLRLSLRNLNVSMIRNILFDLGGILLNLDIDKDTEALLSVGLPDFEGCLNRPEIEEPIMAYLNGLVETDAFIETIRPFCRPDVTREEILWSMDAVLGDLPLSRIEMVKELKRHYQVFLLSNINESAWNYTLRAFEHLGIKPEDCFDRIFLSYEMKMAKPDPEIFRTVFHETGVVPEETLYLDDNADNINTGLSLGLQAHLVPMNHIEQMDIPSLLH